MTRREILQTRQEMIFRTGVKNTLYGSPSIILENATTISNEAYTLIILAGIAALCFIIISIIIIIWLCIRLKRNKHHKHIISSSVKHRKLFNRRLNKDQSLNFAQVIRITNRNQLDKH
ncbi:hypothetical protein Smp_157850 [Schistosoma mansoni]|uniref:hypothetical protein n=1 Tax=Schistosoma mansoni TaxID=6183 RepID=UPI00022DCA1A|nr:hypothetical protein Smp_157850 [Schistosoma mansoni]|eukprot:XP_018654898.1 hypothetical protein Smp_157850 [Schistosoma mansoni]